MPVIKQFVLASPQNLSPEIMLYVKAIESYQLFLGSISKFFPPPQFCAVLIWILHASSFITRLFVYSRHCLCLHYLHARIKWVI